MKVRPAWVWPLGSSVADQEGFLPVCRSLALEGLRGPGSLLAGRGGPAPLRAKGLWGPLRQVTPVSSVPSRVTVSVCGSCLSSSKAGLLPSTPSPRPDLIFLQVLFPGWGGKHVYLWLVHVGVWQTPSEYCKVIIFQFK